ncbi:hypothetical protein BDR04DRAFT_972878, partial [Suillus decipiens]
QCAILVFEGLFLSDYNGLIQSLLYQFVKWHALAKLRIHSESTLNFLEELFKKLSQKLHKFKSYTCAAFHSVQLPKEKPAHQQKSAQCSETNSTSPESLASGPRMKKFHLGTYKFYTMSDYVRTVRFFRTMDSFTTKIMCTYS